VRGEETAAALLYISWVGCALGAWPTFLIYVKKSFGSCKFFALLFSLFSFLNTFALGNRDDFLVSLG
jgi:hypothetical protein